MASHGGLAARLEGPRGTLSVTLPPGLPGLFTRVAVLLSTEAGGARGHTTQVTAPFGRGGGGRGRQVAAWPPGVAHNCTRVHGAVLA